MGKSTVPHPESLFARRRAAITVVSIGLLEGVTGPVNDQAAVVTKTERAGVFRFDSSDLSAEVGADSEQGQFVAPTTDPTGASGAWRRVDSPTPEHFGYDGTSGTSAALAAFVAAGGRSLHGDIEYSGLLSLPENGDYSGLTINGMRIGRAGTMRHYHAERPEGFDWDALGHRFWLDENGLLQSSIDPATYDVAGSSGTATEYFVALGGDLGAGNAGTDPANPLGAMYQALSKVEANGDANAVIWITPGYYDNAEVWGTNEVLTSNVSIKPWNGETSAPYYDATDRPVIITTGDSTLVWVDTGNGSYSAARSAACAVVDAAIINRHGDWSYYQLADDLAACDATPGTWFQDGSTLYVHTLDGRAPDAEIKVYTNKNSGRAGDGNYSAYIDRVWFYGGQRAFSSNVPAGSTEQTLFFKDCRFFYGAENGLGLRGITYTITYRCQAAYNRDDGLNYHSESGGTTRPPYVIEYKNRAYNNGQTWSPLLQACQGTTTHDGSRIVRAGVVSFENDRQQFADVGGSQSWLFHCQARADTKPYETARFAGFSVSEGDMWLDHCDTEGNDYALVATGSSNMKVRNCDLPPRLYVAQNMQGW